MASPWPAFELWLLLHSSHILGSLPLIFSDAWLAARFKCASKDEVSLVTALTEASLKFRTAAFEREIPNCSFRERCANIFFSSTRPKLWHSELCSQKFLSTSSRVSLDDLIISRKAATPPWLRISELFKKNCWWHWQGMRDTLDLSSYHRELSSRIASDINFPFHSFASRRKENSFFRSSSLCFSLNRCCNHVAVTIKLFFCLLILSSFTLYRQSTSSRTGTNFVFAPSQCQYLCSIAVHLWCLSNVGKYDKLNWGWGISRAFELNWGEICGTSARHDGSTFCGFCWLERFFDGKMATTRG